MIEACSGACSDCSAPIVLDEVDSDRSPGLDSRITRTMGAGALVLLAVPTEDDVAFVGGG